MSARTYLVTGASSGIGRAVSDRLLQDGHRVVGLARSFEKIRHSPPGLTTAEIDLSALDALEERLTHLASQHSDVDGIVCSAGRGRFGSLEEFSFEQIRSLVDLNVTSQIYLLRTFLPAMKRQGRGDIVLIGSEAANKPGPRGAVYAATKAALGGLAAALRAETSKSGVRVAVVHPGMVRTGFYDDTFFSPGPRDDESLLPEDVADAVLQILSARAGAVLDEIHLSPLKRVVRFRDKDE